MSSADRATECGLTCHAHCAHLVPDFCGMSMIVANEILETIQRTKNHNKTSSISSGMSGRTLRAGTMRPSPQSPTMSYQTDASQATTIKQSPDDYGPPAKQPSIEARSAAANSLYGSQSPSYQQPRPPLQQRTTSAAALQAATGGSPMRPSAPNYDSS